jgi:5-hydroxyisourate hydrolase-like protein (transthyretin family)
MRQLRTTLATVGLVLALLAGTSAQVREPRPINSPARGIITGRVEIETNQQRTPVRWAKLTLSAKSDGPTWTTSSDRDGRYTFDGLVAGDYQLRVEKAGFVTATTDVRTAATAATNLLIQRGGAIEGRFIDDRGEPIAGLSVIAERLSGAPDVGTTAGSYESVTDDLGRFRVHSLPAGRYCVNATPPPPASGERLFYPGTVDPAQASIVTVVAGQTRDGVDLTVAASPLSPIAAETLADAAREAENAPEEPGFTARVSGQVLMIDTGQPIVHAFVQIMSMPGTARGIRYSAWTDGDGRFEFRRLAAGAYVVRATATGFVTADGSLREPQGTGTQVMIKDGDRHDRANLVLRRGSSIESRVFDEFGDPAPGVVVRVTQKLAALGVSRFLPDVAGAFRSTGATDDRGWFRATGLFPGDYYVIAIPEPFERSSPGFRTTYFPGVTTAEAAQAVHIVAGIDALNSTFNLAAARTETISGVATDADGRPVLNPLIVLLPIDNGELRLMASVRATASPDGTFSFRDLPEGNYVVQGMVQSQTPAENMFGAAHVSVAPAASKEPRPVALMLRRAATVRGRVTFIGGAPTPAPAGVVVFFQATDFSSGPVGGTGVPGGSQMSGDRTFEISGFPQRGVLRVIPPPGWAVARILSQGRDIANAPFDFPDSDVSGIEVVVTNRVGSVSGKVVSGGQPAQGVIVVVFGAEGIDYLTFLLSVRSARTNAEGGFSVSGLLPGRYLAVAIPVSNAMDDQAKVAALRSVATPVLVLEGGNAAVQLLIVK